MIELSDVIGELRAQLATSMAAGADETVRFEVGPVEIEATVAVTREGGASGKVRLWVVDADANGKYTHAQTQRVTVTLTPTVLVDGSPPRPVLIAGDEVAGER